ncbi:MAG: tRNA epoxyqueuosine(34) reductase QueG [Oligoflexia bacterium]|nr:tRNA epoxyqueuosine(34) reductase QueG [Oligoflexia bacterium]
MLDFHQLLIETARRNGFPLAGALDIEGAPIGPHVARYDRWLSRGYAGAMNYLERGRHRRADPTLVFPGAKSILCVAQPYDVRAAGAASSTEGPRYSRYLRAGDYHDGIAAQLELVMTEVARALGDSVVPPLKWKICVDTSAVLERSWAALAGLGWIGKNTMLIHPRLGSYFFIGTVLLDRETGHGAAPLPDYCGHCERCQYSCPTQAFAEPRLLDSTRCLSYLTLEKRGALPIDETHKRAIDTWVAGCDLCQEACPYNVRAARRSEAEPQPVTDDQAIALRGWEELLRESNEGYRERVLGSALSRVKPGQFSRNLAIALGNAILLSPPSDRIRYAGLESLVARRWQDETDEFAKKEWQRCLDAFQPPNLSP